MSDVTFETANVARETDEAVKRRARAIAGVYKRRGKITKQPCAKCGSSRSQMHHPDYSKPLEVVWLCRNCRIEVHGRVIGGKSECSRNGCTEQRAKDDAYCRKHRNEYNRIWARNRTQELKRLRQLTGQTENGQQDQRDP